MRKITKCDIYVQRFYENVVFHAVIVMRKDDKSPSMQILAPFRTL